jgi:serine/threonine protein kinase
MHEDFIAREIGDWEQESRERMITYEDKAPMSGKFAKVYFANWRDTAVVIKSQKLRFPQDLSDLCYRELVIFKTLTKLDSGSIAIHDWFKSDGDFTSVGMPRMNYVLERADETLQQFVSRRSKIPMETYKSILFQILYFLHRAQTECEFVHHDLHLKNIMLKQVDPSRKEIVYNGMSFVCRESFAVKITDFGASRIRLQDGVVIYNPSNHVNGNQFNPCVDLVKIKQEVDRIKIDWPEGSGEEMKMHRALKKILGKESWFVNWDEILGHAFFKSLRGSGGDVCKDGVRKGENVCKDEGVCRSSRRKWEGMIGRNKKVKL